MIRKRIFTSGISCLMLCAQVLSAQTFDLIPLYGMRVTHSGLSYAGITLKTTEGGFVINNEIPQNKEFSIVVQKPEGFRDSAGWVLYGLEYTLVREDGSVVLNVPDVFGFSGIATDTALQSISLTSTFDAQSKPGSKYTILGKVFDRHGSGYISFAYDLKVVSASKKLLTRVYAYDSKDSRGMKSVSMGLHFNFFEFKGLTGNNFLFRIKKNDPLELLLRGLEGWKSADGKVQPVADITLLDVDGNQLEVGTDILSKSIGNSMPDDKKELAIKYKPETKLQSGQFYFAWVRLRDGNSAKSAMDIVVKFYVED